MSLNMMPVSSTFPLSGSGRVPQLTPVWERGEGWGGGEKREGERRGRGREEGGREEGEGEGGRGGDSPLYDEV